MQGAYVIDKMQPPAFSTSKCPLNALECPSIQKLSANTYYRYVQITTVY